MKYIGFITIIDDEGNEVFERELSGDEMIAVLANAAGSKQTVPVTVPESEARAPKTRKATPPPRTGSVGKGQPQACSRCGRSGHKRPTCTFRRRRTPLLRS